MTATSIVVRIALWPLFYLLSGLDFELRRVVGEILNILEAVIIVFSGFLNSHCLASLSRMRASISVFNLEELIMMISRQIG